jgi:Zn-dependent M28 family amino/carboxypeptidase
VTVTFTSSCKNLPDAESANAVGEIRGSEAPDEVVVIGGHLDSWDVGTGAQDDGAGCAITMEAMRLIRSLGLKPKRTIRAVLFTNEENGLRGGKAYADAHTAELSKHVAAIESDSGARDRSGFGVSAGSAERTS